MSSFAAGDSGHDWSPVVGGRLVPVPLGADPSLKAAGRAARLEDSVIRRVAALGVRPASVEDKTAARPPGVDRGYRNPDAEIRWTRRGLETRGRDARPLLRPGRRPELLNEGGG